MTTMSVVGECFFWYRLTRVVPDKFHRAVKWLCVCVSVQISKHLVTTVGVTKSFQRRLILVTCWSHSASSSVYSAVVDWAWGNVVRYYESGISVSALLSFYARQHICYSAYMLWPFRLSVCLSVRLSVTRVDQSKTVEARITQFSTYSSPIPLVFR